MAALDLTVFYTFAGERAQHPAWRYPLAGQYTTKACCKTLQTIEFIQRKIYMYLLSRFVGGVVFHC